MGDSDFSLTTFSQCGKLGQLEHALKAVSPGGRFVGVKVPQIKLLGPISSGAIDWPF
jgi:20S proteasome alpha/beta subunit